MTPLSFLKVLDLTEKIPYTGSMLADYGAEVLKIEKPEIGDPLRYRGSYYSYYGRNKESMTLDYTTMEGSSILRNLVSSYDMIIWSIGEDKLTPYGLDYESLKVLNPSIIYGVITPYGENGPWKDQPDYDLLIMSKAGLQEKTGFKERPTKFGAPIGYIYAARHLSAGMLAAYLKAMETGKGCKVSVSTWQTMFSLDDTFKACFQGLNVLPERLGNGFPTTNPTDTFKCKNGWFSLSIGSDDQWINFAHAAGVPLWWEDDRYAHDPARSMENYFGDLDQQLRDFFETITIEEADRICQEAIVPGGPCNGVKELTQNNPQVESRHMLVHVDGELQLGRPAKFLDDEDADEDLRRAHALGEDTEKILKLLGYEDTAIAMLKDKKII